ncbi:hypothetical protein BKA65DRAFT_470142 [Rhexocercosporidium sp. MPI-PUGE-AT-0058]|nr:hypothetical protein BKA65DRAFT_470142 [Rhexocercosporidium sp. MPI-PUGE-AT-0058]
MISYAIKESPCFTSREASLSCWSGALLLGQPRSARECRAVHNPIISSNLPSNPSPITSITIFSIILTTLSI